MLFYHGTLKRNVPSILRTGLRAAFGFGAEKPGVFLSSSYEDALHWAKEAQENA
jgi:RNA:NAD 2'-phosphotransferase (TPT1/KptA family)